MLSNEEKAEARQLFQADSGSRVCMFCGGIHSRACARVAEFELYDGGDPQKLKRVRFWPAGEWDDAHVIWPEDAFADDDGDEGQGG